MKPRFLRDRWSIPAVVFGVIFLGLNVAREAGAQEAAPTPPIFPAATAATPIAPPSADPAPAPAVPPVPLPPPLAWDSIQKETTTTLGQETAEFEFTVTNILDKPVTIENLVPSCGCTIAKMPSPAPWVMAPHTSGTVEVSVNLAGKSGTVPKQVRVVVEGYPDEWLGLVMHLPDQSRQLNMLAAKTDRQAVFKGDCAKCHSDPTAGKLAKELYDESCGKCHDAPQRATMVPDLHHLGHPTDYAFWKMMVTIGKPGTLMPGYGQAAGGPLNDEQIDSLAKTLVKMYPSQGMTNAANGSSPTRN